MYLFHVGYVFHEDGGWRVIILGKVPQMGETQFGINVLKCPIKVWGNPLCADSRLFETPVSGRFANEDIRLEVDGVDKGFFWFLPMMLLETYQIKSYNLKEITQQNHIPPSLHRSSPLAQQERSRRTFAAQVDP